MEWQISNANLVYTGVNSQNDRIDRIDSIKVDISRNLHIKNGRILKVLDAEETLPDLATVNLHGLLAYPSFINAHDTLLASYYPFVPENNPSFGAEIETSPYTNWLTWDNDIKTSAMFNQRMLLSAAELYQLGSYRNILSGVTQVADHIPHHVRRPFQDQILPASLKDFGVSHSVCSYALEWGDGIRKEYEKAIENDLPFIVHIAEGFDKESKDSLTMLKEAGALGSHTVLVHGLSLSLDDLDQIALAQAHLVWCPVSNWYIYKKIAPIKEALERGINICLGSDAAMHGSNNLLEDINMAGKIYERQYSEHLDPKTFLTMLRKNSELAFRLKTTSSLEQGSNADILIINGKYHKDPFSSLIEMNMEDIYLLVQNGEPIYGDSSLEDIFIASKMPFEKFRISNNDKIIRKHEGKNMKSLLNLIQKTSSRNNFDFLPIITQ